MKKKLTQRDIAGILKVDTKTIYNWRKNKPELYKIIMLGFKFDEFIQKTKQNLSDLEDFAKETQKNKTDKQQEHKQQKHKI